MKMPMLIPAICLLLSACGGDSDPSHHETPESAPTAAVAKMDVKRDTILNLTLSSDASQSYTLYVPKSVTNTDSAPCIIFFDPHGDGSLPVTKYRKLADEYGVILAGSNNSKNGIDIAQSNLFANNVISDLTGRVGVNSKNIALAGFSGGAKVAMTVAGSNPIISKVIYAGAAADPNANHPISLLGFAGTEDMNYSDLVAFAAQSNASNHLIELWYGKHEWPLENVYRSAFEWVYFGMARRSQDFDSMLQTTMMRYETGRMGIMTSKHIELSQMEADDDYKTEIFILKGVTDVSALMREDSLIRSGKEYQQLLGQKNTMLQNENNQKQMLVQALQSKNGAWWTTTINGYKNSTASTINVYKNSSATSDKRLLGFISLACYSYSSQMLQRGELDGAEHFLAIYELADPDNTDQLYFHAQLYARKNDKDKAISYLSKAVKNGYNDWRKIESEPAFIPLQGNERFSQLLVSLKNSSR